MTNSELFSITALGNLEPMSKEIGQVTIAELSDISIASVAVRDNKVTAFKRAAKKAIGAALPDPRSSVDTSDFTAVWTGPGQWFVLAKESDQEDLAGYLKKQFSDTASITEQTGGWCVFDLNGEDVIHALQRLIAVDTAKMVTGSAERSVIEHIGVIIICTETGTGFRILGPGSYAGSLYHALETAAISVATISDL